MPVMGGWRRALGCVAVVLSAPGPATASQQALQEALARAAALDVRCGVAVIAADGAPLFVHRADELFIPASNQKVLTAAGALHALGVDYEFETGFELAGGVLRVTAGGDPNLESGSAHDGRRTFTAVARRLRELGVSSLDGVALDRGVFVGPARPRGWPTDQLHRPYCAPTAGLALDRGCFEVWGSVRDGAARLEVIAPVGVPLIDRVTVSRRRATFGVHERDGALVAGGRLQPGKDARKVAGSVADPEAVFGRVLRRALRDGGIRVGDATVAPAGAPVSVVALHRSPLRAALQPMLHDSSNFHAEQVLRTMGAVREGEGSFAAGGRALGAALAELAGRLPAGAVIADGSGLSRDNRVSPRWLASVLVAAMRAPLGRVLHGALPRPGEGSLRRRFAGSPVRAEVSAKTGWIAGASSLSGWVRGRAFAILMNYDPAVAGLNKDLKRLQEQIVEAAAELSLP